jgi:uncharacterized protein YdeI (BOF family)
MHKQYLMKNLILIVAITIFSDAAFAQQKIDLSKDPSRPATELPKTNAELLKEQAQPTAPSTEADLAEKYKTDATPSGTTTTRTIQAVDAPAPSLAPNPSVIVNKTNQQTNLGNGVKANTYIYHDNEGKAKGSGTSIEFGSGKKK